jgi:hypothetical protein
MANTIFTQLTRLTQQFAVITCHTTKVMRSILTCLLVHFLITIQAQSLPHEDYLKQNAVAWNDSNSNIDKVLNPGLLNNQFLLIGESHGVRYTHELEFDLLCQLKKRTGFRYLVMELGVLDEVYLNRYLQSGNAAYLDSFFRFHRATFFFNKSEEQFFRNLYRLNQSLPEKESIRIFCIDLDFAHRDAIAFLKREWLFHLPATEKAPFDSIQPKTDSSAGIIRKFESAYTYFINNAKAYQKHLGVVYSDAERMLINIQNRLKIAISGTDGLRDSVMFQNFQTYVIRNKMENEKIAGIMGSFHTKQEDHEGNPRFATILRKSGLMKGIASFEFAYNGGEVMIPARSFPNDADAKGKMFVNRANGNGILSLPLAQWDLLEPYFDNNKAWFFDLCKENSPFKTSGAFVSEEDNSFFTTQLFQVLVLINNSPATVPYE